MIQTQVTARRIKTGYTVQVYKIADTQPAKPTGTTIPPSGWTSTPPSSGRIWVSTATAVNNKVSSTWSTPVRWNGDKGDSGVPGQNIRQSEWVVGADFHNDDESVKPVRYLDIALLYASNGVVSRYMCEISHIATEENKPGTTAGNAIWTLLSGDFPLFTPLLVADNGDIKFLQSNRIFIYNDQGVPQGGMSGEGYIWMGGKNPSNAKSVDRADGSGIRAGGNMVWDDKGNLKIKGEIEAISGIFNGFFKIPYKKDNGINVTLPKIEDGTNLMLTNKSQNLSLTLPTDLSYDGIQVEIMNAAFSVFTLYVYSPPYVPGHGWDLYWRSEMISKIVLLGDYSTVILKAFISPTSNRLIWRVVNSSDFTRKRDSEVSGSTHIQWIQGY